ncbi:hypothetical protein SAMN02745181_1628 [Rubritalea squalenifaciens DSM 18772]|uniref:Uncharacterized protein n=2 Tax=Rubritalea squalenifaciens TaxID=407226 RepID=A0A1M6HZC7_9BACT|nr:hypothetical protein SAMN02745181_1628 [Rubritalea squalenifaciens DSM 18772]
MDLFRTTMISLTAVILGITSCETSNQPYYGSPSAYGSSSTMQGLIVHGEQYYVKGGVYYKRSGSSYYRVANPYSSAVRAIR